MFPAICYLKFINFCWNLPSLPMKLFRRDFWYNFFLYQCHVKKERNIRRNKKTTVETEHHFEYWTAYCRPSLYLMFILFLSDRNMLLYVSFFTTHLNQRWISCTLFLPKKGQKLFGQEVKKEFSYFMYNIHIVLYWTKGMYLYISSVIFFFFRDLLEIQNI